MSAGPRSLQRLQGRVSLPLTVPWGSLASGHTAPFSVSASTGSCPLCLCAETSLSFLLPLVGRSAQPKSRLVLSQSPLLITSAKTLFTNKIYGIGKT